MDLIGDGQMVPLCRFLSAAFIKVDFFFFMKSKNLVVRMLILIGRCVWCGEDWDKLPPFSNLHFS